MSDDETPNTEKIQAMSGDDFLKRYQSQINSKKKDTWINKSNTEFQNKMYADVKIYIQNLEKLFKMHKEFVDKNCKHSDKAEDQDEVIQVYDSFINIAYTAMGTMKPKEQNQIVELIIGDLTHFTSKSCQEGSVGGTCTDKLIAVANNFYDAINKKAVLEKFVTPLKQLIKNSNGEIPSLSKTYFSTIVTYMNISAKKVIEDNACELWIPAVKGRFLELIIAFNQQPQAIQPHLEETYDEFIDIFDNEMTQTQQQQVARIVTGFTVVCPKKIVERIEIIVEGLETYNKYYYSEALTNLCENGFTDIVASHFTAIVELGTDKDMGYMAGGIISKIGKKTKDEAMMKKCIETLIDIIKKNQINSILMIAMALKEIAMGGETQKKLLKEKYIKEIEGFKNHSDSKLVEQINQLIDIIHDRNLENMENKIEQLKQEMIEYVNSRIDDIKDNYNSSVKTLPMPVDIEVKKSIMNTIFLKFECAQHKNVECEYPGSKEQEGEYFKTKTKEVNKWVKVGCSVFALGKSVIGSDVGGALSALADTFTAATSDDEGKQHFKALMEEPFLTSSEQDKLILQLRAANYFNHFSFDSKFNGWVCYNCKPFERKEEQKSKQSCACTTF